MSTEKPRVFVTQLSARRDPISNIWVPTVNINPAKRFGEIIEILPPGMSIHNPKETVRLIRHQLHHHKFNADDYLLPMGNPVVMAVAGAIAARRANATLKVLVWDRHADNYLDYNLENLV